MKSVTSSLVKITEVSKDYSLGKTIVHALINVSLHVQSGEFLALSGPSGSGKTTLLNLIGCIELPTNGSISIDQKQIKSMSDNELSFLRLEKIGYIFQNFNLIQVLSAQENVEYPLVLQGVGSTSRKARAKEALTHVGLAKFSHHRPMELSGGQRQRVAIARAMVTRPKIILADEPTANLDHNTGEAILDLMQEINKRNKTTFIFSTHDPKVLKRASRIIHLSDGQIEK